MQQIDMLCACPKSTCHYASKEALSSADQLIHRPTGLAHLKTISPLMLLPGRHGLLHMQACSPASFCKTLRKLPNSQRQTQTSGGCIMF